MEIKVQVDWDNDGSFATSGDDISAYVNEVFVRIGMDSPDAHVASVGTASVTLMNDDKRFSPMYASGPYYGKFKPNLPLRVQVVEDATTYTVFVGVARSFSAESGEYGSMLAHIEASDFLAQLQDFQLALPLQRDKTPAHLLKLVTSAAFGGTAATGTAWFAGQPSAGDWLLVDDQTYIFRASVSSTPNEVLIGAGLEETVDNLYAAINGLEGAGTIYGTNTKRPARAYAEPALGYYHLVRRSNPVRYYRLGESAGSTATDRGANGRDATYAGSPTLAVTGAMYGAGFGDPNTAVTFDGVDDCVQVPTIEIANQSFTVECFIKPNTSSPPAQQDIFGFYTANSIRQSLTLRLFSDGSLGLYFYSDDDFSDAGTIAFNGNWYHVAVTYRHAADEAIVYVNGVAVLTANIGPFEGTAPAVRIGCNGAGTDFFKGSIDEWSLHLRALTAAEIAQHYTEKGAYFGVYVAANARGAWGNYIPFGESGTNINVTDTYLVGGADAPAAIDFDTGAATLEIAGDLWASDRTNGLSAIDDVVTSEWGLFWQARDGTLVFRDRNFMFEQCAATPAIVFDGEQNTMLAGADFSTIRNHVVVSWTPRQELALGVIAKADRIVSVPGRGLEAESEPRLGGSAATPNERPPGKTSIRLSAVDPLTGAAIGIESVVLPLVASTDFEINDSQDFDGYDYTNNGLVTFTLAIDGSSIEISFENSALGTLYIRNLQVRGTGWIAQYPQQVVREDAASQAAYKRLTHQIGIPLGGNHQAFAESLAAYTLGRYANPVYQVLGISAENWHDIDSDSLWDVEIGDVVQVSDDWLGIADQKYLVMGMTYSLSHRGATESGIELALGRLDDRTYGVLGNSTYGKIGSTFRLAL